MSALTLSNADLIATFDTIQLPTDQLIQLYELITHPPNLVFSSPVSSTLVKHHQVDDIIQLHHTYKTALHTQSKLLQTREQIIQSIQHVTSHSKLPQLLSTYSTLHHQLTHLHQVLTPSHTSSQTSTHTTRCINLIQQLSSCIYKYYYQYYLLSILMYTFVLQLIHTPVDWILTSEQVRHIVCICCCNSILCSLITSKVLHARTPNKLQLFVTYYTSSTLVFLLHYDRRLMYSLGYQLIQYISVCFLQTIFQAPLDDIFVLQAYLLFGVQVATWVCTLFLSSIVSTFIGFATSLFVIHYASNTNETFQACWLLLHQLVQSFVVDTLQLQHSTALYILQTYFSASNDGTRVTQVPYMSELVTFSLNHLLSFNLSSVSLWSLIQLSPTSIIQPISDALCNHIQTFTTNLSWYKVMQTLVLVHYYYLQPVTALLMKVATLSWYLLCKGGRLYLQLVHEPMFMQDVKTEVESIQQMIKQLNDLK